MDLISSLRTAMQLKFPTKLYCFIHNNALEEMIERSSLLYSPDLCILSSVIHCPLISFAFNSILSRITFTEVRKVALGCFNGVSIFRALRVSWVQGLGLSGFGALGL